MHEMGHAIGLDHTEGTSDIMFTYTSEITEPSENDLSELKRVCAENVSLDRYKRNIDYLKQMFVENKTTIAS